MSIALEEYFANVKGSLQKAERDETKDRIVSLDVIKGIAILLVILAHVSMTTFRPEWKWLNALIYMILDVFGPSMFVFLSCLGVIFSAKKKRDDLDPNAVRNTVLRRAFALMIFAFATNLIINSGLGIFSFWYWTVIQFIAFGQIITFFILKMRKEQRMMLAFLIAYISPSVFNQLTFRMGQAGIDYLSLTVGDLGNFYALLYWLFFYPVFQVPILPWVVIPIVGSIVGENLVDSFNMKNEGRKDAYPTFFKGLLFNGIIMTAFGILSGMNVKIDEFGLNIVERINASPFIDWPGIPEFLIHSSIPNVIYSLGVGMIIIAVSFYICEIKGYKGRITKFFTFFGRFSLSLFAYHTIFLLFFRDSLGIIGVLIYVIVIWISLGFFLYVARYRWKGVGTLEWFIIAAGGLKRLKKKYGRQNA